jgi:hypothetical protein
MYAIEEFILRAISASHLVLGGHGVLLGDTIFNKRLLHNPNNPKAQANKSRLHESLGGVQFE